MITARIAAGAAAACSRGRAVREGVSPTTAGGLKR